MTTHCFNWRMEPTKSKRKERINNYVAVTVAILAAFMAITKVTDDNVCQAMEREKANEVNKWAYYQSKSIKQNLAELGRAQLAGLAGTVPDTRPVLVASSGSTSSANGLAELEAQVAKYDKEIVRYEAEKAEIYAEAKQLEQNYQNLNKRDDQIDLSDATLSIALGMLAVTALTGKWSLLIGSWVVGGFGAVLGLAGLTRLGIHFEWLVKLLS